MFQHHSGLSSPAARGAVAVLLAAICAATISSDATAWPPEESFTAEDMANPANWPNDPDYGYDEDHEGQWNYYSFIPPQTGHNNTLRPDETASGMSVDLAWRWTQGDDRVKIVVTDSGIRWNHPDLLDRAWINLGELQAQEHRPIAQNGGPCAGTGELLGYDCNNDGIVSASDWQFTPGLALPEGDINGNGVLDAGDLIHAFSDGIDGDGNGYVDDISGWDFMKDDNNAFDDTSYGHGTREAQWATAEGNNGTAGLGACHKCRFIPARVGDSFIADANAFAQAVVYATDNGAAIVLCALGTINMNRFTQQALDYAYAHNVLVNTSMADENSRHHNMPATANHSLPSHAIIYSPEKSVTDVRTFIDFSGCTNFGGQNLLSLPGGGCSSEAAAQLSGVSGLLLSAAYRYNLTPRLSAAEMMQLLITTADDIYVPESQEEGSQYYWSQPGFDQRFGYGRVNANTAVERVKDKKIPPEVDIVRPYWFEVLYADQVADAVEIRGHISATRATSYDYVVEWAPGVQPLDSAYNEISRLDNIPHDVVTGGDSEPLALLDVRTIDTTHEPDSDSYHGENEHTITVRVRAVAHYGGAIGDVRGEMRRTVYVHHDPDLLKGFPIYLGDSGESSPKLADLDGDGRRDIVYATSGGRIHVWKITPAGPEELPGFPFAAGRLNGLQDPPLPGQPSHLGAPGYIDAPVEAMGSHVDVSLTGQSFSATPAIADLDDDGRPEIVATTYNGTIYVVKNDATVAAGWPVRLPDVPSCPQDGTPPDGPCMDTGHHIDRAAFASPVLEDMDGDGRLDIIQGAFDGKVYVFDPDGQLLDGWPVTVHYNGSLVEQPNAGRIFTTPAVADFNDDGIPEVLVGSNEKLGEGQQSGAVYLIDGRGTAVSDTPWLENWPITMTSFNLLPLVAEGVGNSGVIGVFDGVRATVTHGNASLPLILPGDPGHQDKLGKTPPNAIPERLNDYGETELGVEPSSRYGELSQAQRPNTMFPLFANPSLGDVDQDGTLDVIASGSSLNLAQSLQGTGTAGKIPGDHLMAVWSGKTGKMLPASPFVLEDYSFFNSHAVADLNGDDYPEVIASSAGYFLHAWDGCGREPEGWPKFTGQWIIPTAAVGDLTGDGMLEVVTGTRNGWLYAWRTEGRTDGIVQWESYHHDNRNTGSFEVPLDQGDPDLRAAEPLTVELCRQLTQGPPAGGDLEPGGGCGACTVRPDSGAGRLAALAVVALLGVLGARRRQRPRRA